MKLQWKNDSELQLTYTSMTGDCVWCKYRKFTHDEWIQDWSILDIIAPLQKLFIYKRPNDLLFFIAKIIMINIGGSWESTFVNSLAMAGNAPRGLLITSLSIPVPRRSFIHVLFLIGFIFAKRFAENQSQDLKLNINSL